MKTSIVVGGVMGLMMSWAVAGCVEPMDDAELGESEEELFKTDYFGWSRDGNGETTTIPICWDEHMYGNGPSDLATRNRYKAWVRRAIEETWQRESAIIFTGWGDCNAGNGGTYGILLQMADRNNGWTNYIHPAWEPQHADVQLPGAVAPEGNFLRYTAIHEIGHALGFVHEQARLDNGGRCTESDDSDWIAGTWPGQILTPWDARSVMNYCAPNPTELSPLDIVGLQRAYGRKPGPSLVGTRGLCVGTSGTAVIPVRCSSANGQLVGGMAPATDWLRLVFMVGTWPSASFPTGLAIAPPSNGLGPLTMTTGSGNSQWDRYKLKDVTIRGLGGRKLRASEGAVTGGDVITWDSGTVTWAAGAAADERWSFLADGTIRGIGGLCLDVQGANPASGTRVQLYPCNGTAAQRWALGPDDTIRSLVSTSVTRCLEVNRDETDTTTPFPTAQPVRIASCTGTLRQKWSTRGAVTSFDNAGCLVVPASGGVVSQASCSSAAEQVIDRHW